MKSRIIPSPPSKQSGIALLEALISILIFSMGILAVMGLQAVSITNTLMSKYRSDASFLTNAIVGRMWADTPNLASYPVALGASSSHPPVAAWKTQIEATLPGGKGAITLSGSDVTVTVSWTIPGVSGSLATQSYKTITTIVP